mgnify:CR=1 FL=1
MSLRTKLIVVFLSATLVPMAVMVWVTIHLFEASLSQATTAELDAIEERLRVEADPEDEDEDRHERPDLAGVQVVQGAGLLG